MKAKIRAALMAAPLSLALGAFAVQPVQAAPEAPSADVPVIDFPKECPPLPEGQDPTLATCMMLVVGGGSMKLGGISQDITKEMRIVIQAIQPSSSEPVEFTKVQLSGEPMKIPGGVFGLLGYPIPALEDLPFVKVEVQPEYTGNFDLQLPNVTLDMKINILNAAAPEGCAIGSAQDPMQLNLAADFTEVESVRPADPDDPFAQPAIVRMPASDTTFAVPKTSGCWLLGPIIDQIAGLPSASGNNSASFDTYLSLALYGQPASAATARSTDPVTKLQELGIGG